MSRSHLTFHLLFVPSRRTPTVGSGGQNHPGEISRSECAALCTFTVFSHVDCLTPVMSPHSRASWWRSLPTTARAWPRPCRCSSTSATASGKGANRSASPTSQVSSVCKGIRKVVHLAAAALSSIQDFKQRLVSIYSDFTAHSYGRIASWPS